MFIQIVQFIGMLIPILCVVSLLQNGSRSESAIRLMLASIGCAVMNGGSLLMCSAQTEAAAGMSVKFSYLGNALFYSFFIAFLLAYLRMRIPHPIFWGWSIFEAVVVVIYWNDKLQERFIGHFNFVRDNVFHVFRAEVAQSPLFQFRCILLVVLLIIGLCTFTVRLLRTKVDSERHNLFLLCAAQFLIIISLIVQLYWQPRIDIMPIFAALSLISIVWNLLRDGFFGVMDTGHDWVFNQMDNAYVITDKLYGYLDSNAKAKKLFPTLESLHTGEPIPKALLTVFKDEGMQHALDDRIYSKKLTQITKKDEIVGYGILLVDITEQELLITEQQKFNARLKAEVERQTQQVRNVQNSIITGMASVVESRDNSTGGHINRTSAVVRIFSKHLKEHPEVHLPNERFLHNVTKAAPMHDIGKIAVDDVILRKPGHFTDEEYHIMQKHAAEGAVMLEKVLKEVNDTEFRQIAINVAHYHHERWDGTGYPEGISGEDIPLEARIMALADVFDALVCKRCYKPAMPYEKAFSLMSKSLGTQFDPVLGRIFLECRPELEAYYDQSNE